MPHRRARRALSALHLGVALAVGGCAYQSRAIPVTGDPDALAALAGDWVGEYSSDATGRSGSISFTLRATSDSAFGEVVMVPAGATSPLARAAPSGEPTTSAAPAAPGSAVLTIRFVRAEPGVVTGSLEPYRAPDCDCMLTTTFRGTPRGDAIEGTFTTTGDPRAERQDGRWRVTRKR